MDAASLQILSHSKEILKTKRALARVYRTLDASEVEAQCWESMWNALQKYERVGHPLYAVYYWQVRSDLQRQVKWYEHRQRYLSFVESDPVIESWDSPENYLEALQNIERRRRPMRSMVAEVMEGLGVLEDAAKRRLKAAKKALGFDNRKAGSRYTEEEKVRILAFLGIQIGSPVD